MAEDGQQDHGHSHDQAAHDHRHDHDRGPARDDGHSHDHGTVHDHGAAHDHAHRHDHAHAAGHVLAAVQTHERAHTHSHDHATGHDHDHDHDHAADHPHAADHDHSHGHSHGRGHHHHHLPDEISTRSLIAMGVSAGMIPCPSALVVLLGAIAQHQIGLGLLLIVLFSLGLATTLTALGLAVVGARRLTARIAVPGRAAGLVAALPALSTVLILGLGFVLTLQALPRLV